MTQACAYRSNSSSCMALVSPYAYFEAPSSTHLLDFLVTSLYADVGISISNTVFSPAQALDRLKVEQRGSLGGRGSLLWGVLRWAGPRLSVQYGVQV